ncbi:Pimeloyl-ACP methyl ester carboxylesterase [Jatrophihabitans endophyticus]|uniref:Pimeloyl-ACP methyl ester carboxylesterase n=1 Tax=Jatrophihabitans endophyticus TaxID=1206085 RepID=A0A1M5MWL5_9ACTN|nr:alpha/beta hydrolase [Jatrophihabitans endophyticus]SHG81716.1 Pimeloyl-ACP methyl ester carboxylesterase [Jatrophihabitans endophyticus]
MIGRRHAIEVDGRTLVAHDGGGDGPVAVWHHGSPQTGALLAPVVEAARARGLRVVSYARPSYGGSSPRPGRAVASAAADVAAVADALGIERYAVVGASGGGPHALACAALTPERVTAVASLAGIAPRDAAIDWYAGMVAPDGLRAAEAGRDARARFVETEEFDEASFVDADWAALAGEWRALGADAGAAGAAGPDGLVDDDVEFVSPWGFALDAVRAPALVVRGGRDRVVPATHGDWLAAALPQAELWARPDDGHVSVLTALPDVLSWLAARSG